MSKIKETVEMPNKSWCIVAPLSAGQRGLLLRMFPPTHEDVYCYQLMWHWNPPDEAPFPKGEIVLRIDGRHFGPNHEALVGSVTSALLVDERTRPDGVPVHIALSTAPGVPPVTAGEIAIERIELVDPVSLSLTFQRRHPSRIRPEPWSMASFDVAV